MRSLLFIPFVFGFMSMEISAQARTVLNSMCYMVDQGGNPRLQGDRAQNLFEVASLSKVVTSYWGLRTLSPQFRFTTRIYVTPVGSGLFDVHIEGAQDPFWGRQLSHFLFSELNRNGIREIRHLTFDENLWFRWRVVSDNNVAMDPTTQEIADALAQHIRHLAAEYPQTRLEAASAGVTLPRALVLKAQSVSFLSRSDFSRAPGTKVFILKSAPLYRYLKEMNVVSNNHVADRLFAYLGGANQFQNFIQTDLNVDASDIHFVNGSGDSVSLGSSPEGKPVKAYNEASCETIVRVLYKMHQFLQRNYKMDLKDVMAVSGADGGTLSPRYDAFPKSIVAKTGTVDPAVNLTGVISTAQGDVYFGVLMGTDSPADWNQARDLIRWRVADLIKRFGGRRTFSYTSKVFLPFDQSSAMNMEVDLTDRKP